MVVGALVIKGELYPKPNLSMIYVLSQNYWHGFFFFFFLKMYASQSIFSEKTQKLY